MFYCCVRRAPEPVRTSEYRDCLQLEEDILPRSAMECLYACIHSPRDPNSIRDLEFWIRKHPDDVNERDLHGRTLTELAVEFSNSHRTRWPVAIVLFKHGTPVCDPAVLRAAVRAKNIPVISAMVSRGCEVHTDDTRYLMSDEFIDVCSELIATNAYGATVTDWIRETIGETMVDYALERFIFFYPRNSPSQLQIQS